MTLENKLLERLADWRPDGRAALSVSDAERGWSAEIVADVNDQVGCKVWEVVLSRATPVELRAWARHAEQQGAGLLEQLRLLEIDPDRQVALLRSRGPSRRGEDLFYYELTLAGSGEGQLRRFRGRRDGSKRQQIAFALTHEALARLLHDLTALP